MTDQVIRQTDVVQHASLFEALAAAQLEFPPIIRDKTAKIRSERTGTSYEFHYAELAQIYEKVRPPLNRHGLSLMQPTDERNGKTYIVTRLDHGATHETFTSAGFAIPENVKPEEKRIAQVKYQRYDLCGVLAISAEEEIGTTEEGKPKSGRTARGEGAARAEEGTRVESPMTPPPLTDEDRSKFASGLRVYADKVGKEPLKAFVLRYVGSKDLKSLTAEQWVAVLEALASAQIAGDDQLVALVNADTHRA